MVNIIAATSAYSFFGFTGYPNSMHFWRMPLKIHSLLESLVSTTMVHFFEFGWRKESHHTTKSVSSPPIRSWWASSFDFDPPFSVLSKNTRTLIFQDAMLKQCLPRLSYTLPASFSICEAD
jgi:hypothetical protein